MKLHENSMIIFNLNASTKHERYEKNVLLIHTYQLHMHSFPINDFIIKMMFGIFKFLFSSNSLIFLIFSYFENIISNIHFLVILHDFFTNQMFAFVCTELIEIVLECN